ncbi:cytochrome P450 2U1-like [Amphiura filiformis]|uniref:cytochrome P450 2U1-like n=1 Tax=Amphiura filiformis TaxID=82378 RepID=UPI003B218760
MISLFLQYYSTSLIYIFTFKVVALTIYWWNRHRRGLSCLPPGPFAWPVLGSLASIAVKLYRSGLQLPVFLQRMGRQFGPIFAVNICGVNIIVLGDYATIKEAFQHPNLSNRPTINSIATEMLAGGIGAASGEIWKRQRNFTLATFRNLSRQASFESMIITECQELVKEISRHANDAFSPEIMFTKATANVICSFVFGRRYNYTDEEFQFLLKSIYRIEQQMRGIGTFIPIFRYLPTRGKLQLGKDLTALLQFMDNIIEEHKVTFDPENLQDYIDIFMKEMQSSGDGLLTNRNLRGTITLLFFAGVESTSNQMRWAIYCMLRYPDVQIAVQAELNNVIGRERMPIMSDKDSLPLTMATLLEIQRFGSTSRFAPLHVASCDAELCGYRIPKGSILLSNLWAVHHDPKIWNDTEEFKPERFLNRDGKVTRQAELIPFSIGRRICPGESMAKIQIFIFFTHLLHRFTLIYPDGADPLRSVDGAKPIPDFLATANLRS